MQWADAVPNLMIGLREGLEAGLVVSILLAALRKIRRPQDSAAEAVSTVPVWLGAVTVAGSLAAILTFSTDVLSSRAQQIVGGSLSVLAVFLVTGMVFWMRRTAMGLSAQLRGEVERAVAIGAGALALTAFLAVGLTVTVSFGASLFDRVGLAARKPKKLTPMKIFPDDAPEAAWMHGDLLIQLCANNPDTVHHALRDLTRHTRGAMQLRWKMHGYNPPPRPSGAGRNLLGFKDGTANPVGGEAGGLVWVDDPAEPAWARGGSYQVVRLIRMLVEFWDRVSINEQEKMFGRRRDSGAPLDGHADTDNPDYAADPKGAVIPLTAHIRKANPRTPATGDQCLVRRPYNYDLGVDANGELQAGHVFVCYQEDVRRQFETVQQRLAGEPLVDYVQPFGGGYFFALPGVRDQVDWYASGMFS
ncbi:Dyp-type peroxidase [Amycolatopsis rubida]|nr:Dyp-type peroxidase [Amycolatopsis rubida]